MKIVLVEDNEVLAKSIVGVLEEEGHTVKRFGDGLDARSFLLVERDAIDIAIVDFMLPGVDGVTLIRELRAEGVTVPILMLTARGEIRDKVYGLESGVDYYLTKPFEFEELLACLKALRRRSPQYQKEQVAITSYLTFDTHMHVLIKGEEVIPLTPTESGILEQLLRNRGNAMSQHELGERVFDFAKEHWSNTIEVHIKNLRKKMHYEEYENPIKTIRGRGYCISL